MEAKDQHSSESFSGGVIDTLIQIYGTDVRSVAQTKELGMFYFDTWVAILQLISTIVLLS